jgi:hypothetical protein
MHKVIKTRCKDGINKRSSPCHTNPLTMVSMLLPMLYADAKAAPDHTQNV